MAWCRLELVLLTFWHLCVALGFSPGLQGSGLRHCGCRLPVTVNKAAIAPTHEWRCRKQGMGWSHVGGVRVSHSKAGRALASSLSGDDGGKKASSDPGNNPDPGWRKRVIVAVAAAWARILNMFRRVLPGVGRKKGTGAADYSKLFRVNPRGRSGLAGCLQSLIGDKRILGVAAFLLALGLRMGISGPMMSSKRPAPPQEVPYSVMMSLAKKGTKSGMTDVQVGKTGEVSYNLKGEPSFTRPVYMTQLTAEAFLEGKVPFTSAPPKPSLGPLLLQALPIIWLLGLLGVMRNNMSGGIGKAGKLAKTSEVDRSLTFNEVAGVDEAKMEVKELVEILRDPRPYVQAGARLPSGVMLVGPPGTGKTLLARVMASEAGVPYYYCSGSDFVEVFVGRGAARVRKLFSQASSTAPCIIFFDELDALGRQRGGIMRSGNDEAEQTLNQLLACMDGLDTNNNGVIVMAATNRFDVLDEALTRPGRFDRVVKVPVPDEIGREEILAVHTSKMKLEEELILRAIAIATPGLTGAELASVCNEAAIRAARRKSMSVSLADFQGAVGNFYISRNRTPLQLPNLRKMLGG
ncbi:unnamed protein product [Chrysoparadoxa australica]